MIKSVSFLLFSFFLLCTSCKKGAAANNPILEQYFETNILNRNFIVSLAKDNSTNLTTDYNGYVFVLLKTDLYHGPLQAKKNGITYMGTWNSNSDYGKLIITLPNPPAEFIFLNRSWRFTSKNLPTLKFAQWGSSAPIELNMQQQ